jgi:putative acetyltransferase
MIEIRPETPADVHAIHKMVDAAFHQSSEGLLIDNLREGGDLVLSLVAVDGDRIVGHIGFARLKIDQPDFSSFDAVALAPLSVHPDHQDQGIGGDLIVAAHKILIAAGEKLSVVLGDPEYYGRFGYRRDIAEGFESGYQSDFLLARPFSEDFPRTGILRYPPAFSEM